MMIESAQQRGVHSIEQISRYLVYSAILLFISVMFPRTYHTNHTSISASQDGTIEYITHISCFCHLKTSFISRTFCCSSSRYYLHTNCKVYFQQKIHCTLVPYISSSIDAQYGSFHHKLYVGKIKLVSLLCITL